MTLKNETEVRKLYDSGLKKLAPELLGIKLPSFGDVTIMLYILFSTKISTTCVN